MGSYIGPAVVVSDGVEYEVIAELTSRTVLAAKDADTLLETGRVPDHLRKWVGIIRMRNTSDAESITEATTRVLRTSDTQEDSFTVTDGDYLPASELQIAGGGSPPFDE